MTDQRATGARMLAVFMPQVVFYGMGVVLIGVLQAHRRFLGPALAPLVSSAVVMGAYLVFDVVADRRETDLSTLTRGHELVLSVGTTLGVAALTIPLWLSVRRTGRRLAPTLTFPPGVAATARRMAVAGAVVLGSQDLATAGILRLANDGGSRGSVVLYNLAWTVFLLPWAVLAVPLATTAFPALASRWQTGDRANYADSTARTARTVILVTAGAAAALVAVATPAARILVLGAPGSASPEVLARALVAFAPGLVGYGLVALLSRSHYARGEARTAAVAVAVGWTAALIVGVVLVATTPRSWTPAVLAAGTAAGMTVAAVWLSVALRRRAGRAALAGVGRSLTAALTAGVAAAAIGYAVVSALPTAAVRGSVAVLAVGMAVAGAAYLAGALALDRSTMLPLVRRLRHLGRV